MRSIAASLVLLVGAAQLALGQNASSNATVGSNSTSNFSRWTLSSTNFNRSSWSVQPYVSNGYIGQRIPVEGFGYMQFAPNILNGSKSDGTNGWPLFDPRLTAAMVAGFYDQQENTTGTNFDQTGGQQPIALIPTWSSLYVTVNNNTYSTATPESEITNWTQSASIQDGLVKTSLMWSPGTNISNITLQYTIYAHRVNPNLGAVALEISGLAEGANLSVTDVLDGAGAWRTTFVNSSASAENRTIMTAVQPNGISNVTAFEYSLVDFGNASVTASPSCTTGVVSTNASTISQCYSLTAPASGRLSVYKYVGIASSDAFPGVELETARQAATSAQSDGWNATLATHTAAWDAIWEEGDIEIPGDEFEELQLATRASLFNLLSNVRNGSESTGLGDNGIAPAGLTSDSYAGQIFWDAPTWMYPSLLALQPDYAESIVDFYWRQYGAAQENAKQFNSSGVLYPWTAGRFGNCTGVGPCYDYEYHYNNDIALAVFQQYASSQNRTWLETKGWPIVRSVAEFWANHVVYNETTLSYDTFNETDPDEYANFVNNAAFTNAGVSVILRKAMELASVLNLTDTIPSNWSTISSNITILRDPTSNIVLEFEGFNGTTSVKQADVVLLLYPLEYETSKTQGAVDLQFHAGATSANGPGMTYSIFSIDESAVAAAGCGSYTYLLQASQPYSRAPFYQFSEQTTDEYATNGGTNPAYTFLTGHGGFLQAFTHGFTGYRSRLNTLFLDPVLPTQLTNYTIKGMKKGGSVLDLVLTTANTTIIHKSGASNLTVEIASGNGKAGNYSLGVGETLVVPTRKTNGTVVEGNAAQCAKVLSNDSSFTLDMPLVVPGQYALAAIDGSNATTWQPLGNTSTTLSIDLMNSTSIKAFHVNWGGNPATAYSISAGSSLTNMTNVASGNVTISSAYNATEAVIVAVTVGNTTDVSLTQPVQARYINMTIEGSFLADGKGGTIAEFAAISA